jgi:hypothetical protein
VGLTVIVKHVGAEVVLVRTVGWRPGGRSLPVLWFPADDNVEGADSAGVLVGECHGV